MILLLSFVLLFLRMGRFLAQSLKSPVAFYKFMRGGMPCVVISAPNLDFFHRARRRTACGHGTDKKTFAAFRYVMIYAAGCHTRGCPIVDFVLPEHVRFFASHH